jgi:hypothetical protein
MWKPKEVENHRMFFLVFLEELHPLEAPLFSNCNWKEAPTPLFIRLQLEGSSKSPIMWLQIEGGYNPLCSPTTTERWLQPPVLAPCNRPAVEVE